MGLFSKLKYIPVLKQRNFELTKRVKALEDRAVVTSNAIKIFDELLAWTINKNKAITISLIEVFGILKSIQGVSAKQSVFGAEISKAIVALGTSLRSIDDKNVNLDSILKHLKDKVDYFTQGEEPDVK